MFFAEHLRGGREPLLADVRAAAIANLLARSDADVPHARARRVGSRCSSTTRWHAQGIIEPTADERELLRAAAMAHDTGMAVAYDGHAAHAHYLILHADLPGFSPRDVALIAQVVRYHRKGSPALDELRPSRARATTSSWRAAPCCCASPSSSTAARTGGSSARR